MIDVRIPPLPVAQWQPGLLDKINALTDGQVRADNNVYCTLANYPSMFQAWMRLGSHLFRRSTLPSRERELVILRAAALSRGRYPFVQHVAVGRDCGLAEADIAAVLVGPKDPRWQPAERHLLTVVDQLLIGGGVSDAAWQDLSVDLSHHQCLDLAATAAFYRLASWLLNSCGTLLQEGQAEPDFGAVPRPDLPDATAFHGDPRIQPLAPENWSAELLEETADWPRFRNRPELRKAGVYKTFANHLNLFSAIGGLMAHILSANSLPDREREVVIIRACARARGAYPYRQHMRIGRQAGLSENELTALSQIHVAGLSPEVQILADMVDVLFRDDNLDDSIWNRAQSLLSREQILDTIVVSGFYGLVSAVLNMARTSQEPGDDSLPEHFITEGPS